MPKTVAILAGNKREYEQHLRENREEGVEYIYANNPEKLRGVFLDDYIEIGTFYNDSKNKEIRKAAERRVQINKQVDNR